MVTKILVQRVPGEASEKSRGLVRQLICQALDFQGCVGISVLQLPENPNEIKVSLTFDSAATWNSFERCFNYIKWREGLDDTWGDALQISNETTEKLARQPAEGTPPPAWKQAVVTWVGVNIMTFILAFLLNPWLAGLPFIANLAVFNAAVVIGLTWLVMPALTQALHSWLVPERT